MGNIKYEIKDGKKKLVGMIPRNNFDIKGLKMTPEEIKSERELHIQILEKTIEIINYYKKLNPDLIYFIENPAFGYMKFYLDGRVDFINSATYCQYGFDYRKETYIFSNLELDLKRCGKKDKCHSDNFYSGGSDERKMKRTKSVNTYFDKSIVPPLLCKSVLELCISALDPDQPIRVFGSIRPPIDIQNIYILNSFTPDEKKELFINWRNNRYIQKYYYSKTS